jgi:hypothetical protein
VTRESLTPAYAPPEAFELTEPTAAGDVYALAATLYALLQGRPPRFPEGGVVNLAVIMVLHRRPIPEIPGVPPALTAVLRHGMATDPAQRVQTAAEFGDALAALDVDGSSMASGGRPPAAPSYAMTGPGAGRSADPLSTGPSLLAEAGRPHTVPAGRPTGGSRQSTIFAAVAAVFALLIAVGVGVLIFDRPGSPPPAAGRPPGPPPGQPGGPPPPNYEVPVTSTGCPATAVQGVVGAACVVKPECWDGLTSISGDATARPKPCESPHSWETFAIAPMPLDLTTSDQDTVARHPAVAGLCTMTLLLRSRSGAATKLTPDRWEAAVLPPSAARFAAGSRVYRCVGHVTGKETTGSAFAVQG